MKKQIHPLLATKKKILIKGARIFREIFLGAELCGIHKNGNHNTSIRISQSPCFPDQRAMPLMKGAHCGNKNHR